MNVREVLRVLAELSSAQWGMFTSQQASQRGVTRLNLSRLADSGDLIRIRHGVYGDAGAAFDEHQDLRAAWLSSEPTLLAEERIALPVANVTVSGVSSAALHRIGDLPAHRHQFTTSMRRQTQQPDIHYRQKKLDASDVTIVAGLPVMTMERTIADLVEQRTDLSLVADALNDAAAKRPLNFDQLTDYLSPLAARNGFRTQDGDAFMQHLAEFAGIDAASFAEQIAESPAITLFVTQSILAKIDFSTLIENIEQLYFAVYGNQKFVSAMKEAKKIFTDFAAQTAFAENLSKSFANARSIAPTYDTMEQFQDLVATAAHVSSPTFETNRQLLASLEPMRTALRGVYTPKLAKPLDE